MKKNNFETIIKPICNWTANKIREQGKVLDSRYQWQIKINQHTGIYKNRFLLNTYKEHSRGVQGRMIPGTGTPGYRPFDYLGYTKGTGILEGVVPLHIKPSTCCEILATLVDFSPCIYPVVSEFIHRYNTKKDTHFTKVYSPRRTIIEINTEKFSGIQTVASINPYSNLPLLRNRTNYFTETDYFNRTIFFEVSAKAS